jgi:hypothetical protein
MKVFAENQTKYLLTTFVFEDYEFQVAMFKV